jgi:hypothetical protein
MNKNKKNLFFVLGLVLILLLPSVTVVNSSADPLTAKWTVMIYFAGDLKQRLDDVDWILNILTGVGSSDDFNIVILIDSVPADDTTYYFVNEGSLTKLEWYEKESNMADPITFENFIKITKENYPANHYALFTLSAYGSGWQGVIFDTHGMCRTKKGTILEMPDVKKALIKSTDNGSNKIDIWTIDVCVPGMIEVAYQIAPYVNYMVANQEHGFGGDDPDGSFGDDGTPLALNYSSFLQQLKDNPDMSPEEFSILIVDTYQSSVKTSFIFNNPSIKIPKWYPIVKFYTTLAATNLSKIDLLTNAVSELADELNNNLLKNRKDIRKARDETREYGKFYKKFWFLPGNIQFSIQMTPLSYNCFIDLYDFVENLKNRTNSQDIKQLCQEIIDAVNQVVIANEAVPGDSSHGLSIYFPEYRCQYDKSIWLYPGNIKYRFISSYNLLEFTKDTKWDEFIQHYLGCLRVFK